MNSTKHTESVKVILKERCRKFAVHVGQARTTRRFDRCLSWRSGGAGL